jgi:hypothetical protein
MEIIQIINHDLLVFLSKLIIVTTLLNLLFKIYLDDQILLAIDTFGVNYKVSNRLIFLLSFISLVGLSKIYDFK